MILKVYFMYNTPSHTHVILFRAVFTRERERQTDKKREIEKQRESERER